MKHIVNDFSDVWKDTCKYYHGEILTGNFCHFCPEVGRMPIDETCKLWSECKCFTEKELKQGHPEKIESLNDLEKLKDNE